MDHNTILAVLMLRNRDSGTSGLPSGSSGGMPTLASDGSDAGKFVKANEDGTGYELDSIGGECDWNTMKNKPFGIEIAKTTIFRGDVEMVSEAMGDVFITQGTVPSGLSSIPEDLTITVDGVSTVIKVGVGSFAYNGKNVHVDKSKDDSGNWTNLSFIHSGNTDYTIEDISIEAVTETVRPIDPKLIVLTSPNGTKYNLTVADDGTLSAVAAE